MLYHNSTLMIIDLKKKGVKCEKCGHEWVVRSTNEEKKRFQCSKCGKATVIKTK